MADGSGLSRQLDERIAHARRGLAFPAGAKAARAAAVWIFIFGVFWFSGLHDRLGEVWKAASGLTFYVGLAVTFFIGLKSWRRPSDQDARDLIDDMIEGRPLSAWADRPARTDDDGWRLWSAHRERMAAMAARAGALSFRRQWKEADPLYLRAIIPIVLLAAGLAAGPKSGERLIAGLTPDVGALFGAHTLKVEAWITPPAYTGDAPFVLTPGETANAPQGSEVTLRIISPGRPEIRILPAAGGGRSLRPEADAEGAFQALVPLTEPMRISVRFWGERASFPFTMIPDAPPKVEFVSPPKLGEGDRTEFEWKLSDDYGVTRLELVARMAEPPAGAEGVLDFVAIETMGLNPTEESGAYSEDLVRHRWAGLEVFVKLRATDASGAFGESAEARYKLPEKLFLQPIARSAQEIRASLLREWREYQPPSPDDRFTKIKGEDLSAFAAAGASRLRAAPEGVKLAVLMIDALTYKPEGYFEDPVNFMGLRHARAMIDAARTKPEAESAEDILWNVALRAEYGTVSDAKAALEAARRALEEALRNGASEEDIQRLMDMFEQAVENYLAAQMAEALREGRVSEADNQQGAQQGGGRPLGDDELQRMLDALRDLSETGARDQARQLLSDMSKMLERMENMQLQMGGGGGGGPPQEGPMSRALNRALQETNRTLNDQRDLADQTEQAMRNGGDTQRLADQQRALRERLEEQMRSGGGQPPGPMGGQPGQAQSGSNQGQGQGQDGDPNGRQGQGQAGRDPNGQGQPGEGRGDNQNSAPGRDGQQASPNGGGGRPGVNADGRQGQESARSRQLLAQALDAQRRAEGALRRGDLEAAREAQRDAMASLQARSGELARLADSEDPENRADREERDVLGRMSNGDSGYGDTVEVPEEMERQKARDILNELRRRAGERDLTPEELDYLRRLLDRF